LEKKSKWGGVRPNSGRPKGGMNKETKEKVKVQAKINQRILQNADKIFNAQMQLVEGCSYLYRIDQDDKGKKQKAVLVTCPKEIQKYLDDEVTDQGTYYYMTAEKPNIKAIDSAFDRVFGKAHQSIEQTNIVHNFEYEDKTDEQIDARIKQLNDEYKTRTT